MYLTCLPVFIKKWTTSSNHFGHSGPGAEVRQRRTLRLEVESGNRWTVQSTKAKLFYFLQNEIEKGSHSGGSMFNLPNNSGLPLLSGNFYCLHLPLSMFINACCTTQFNHIRNKLNHTLNLALPSLPYVKADARYLTLEFNTEIPLSTLNCVQVC